MNPSPFPDYMRPDATWADVLADFVLMGCGLGALVFVILYGIFLNWRETPAGKALFYFMASLAAVLVLVILSRLTGGDYPGRDLVRLGVYSAGFVTSWRLVVELIRSWREGADGLNINRRERTRTGSNRTTPEA